MPTLFVDASVIFAMAHSAAGASRELHALAVRKAVILITSNYELSEISRRISNDYPDSLPSFAMIRAHNLFVVVDADAHEVNEAVSAVPMYLMHPLLLRQSLRALMRW